eukprot:12168281-Alexandrium_andersonii.AAC.1
MRQDSHSRPGGSGVWTLGRQKQATLLPHRCPPTRPMDAPGTPPAAPAPVRCLVTRARAGDRGNAPGAPDPVPCLIAGQ